MLIETFHDYLKIERNYSSHTIDAYLRDLKNFAAFISEFYEFDILSTPGVGEVSHKMIRSWMGHLLEEGKGKRSVARKIASLNAWYRFLLKREIVTENPAARVKAPKFEKKLPAFLKEESVHNLFEGIEFEDDFDGRRDKAILEVLYSCGIRRSELVGLRYENIDFKAMTLKIMGKGRKERVVPFGTMAAGAMKAYINMVKELDFSLKNAFFLTRKGQPIYPKLVNNIVEKYLSQVCSLKKKSPHVLRHTFATHLLDRGADLNAIKELLGHTSLAATQVYTHNSISKLKDVYKKAHPKA